MLYVYLVLSIFLVPFVITSLQPKTESISLQLLKFSSHVTDYADRTAINVDTLLALCPMLQDGIPYGYKESFDLCMVSAEKSYLRSEHKPGSAPPAKIVIVIDCLKVACQTIDHQTTQRLLQQEL